MNTPKWFSDFAKKRRLKITEDPCNDPWILGMYGHLSVYHTDNPKNKMICIVLERKSTAYAKGALLRAKPDLVIAECEYELIAAINVKNGKYLTKAIKILEIPRKRKISDKEAKKLTERLQKARESKKGGSA